MQTRSSDNNCLFVCLSDCLSVCLPDKRVDCDKTEERSLQIFIPEKKNGWWGRPEVFGQPVPVGSEIADFEPIFARRASAVTSREKVQLTYRKSTRFLI